MKYIIYSVLFLISFSSSAQQEMHFYPRHWWAGMKDNRLQLMIRSNHDLPATAFVKGRGVRLKQVYQPRNKHYLILDLQFTRSARPGDIEIKIGGETFRYALKARNSANGKTRITGVNSGDFIYLIMPDRFSNGDPSNDRIEGMLDMTLNRDSIFHRHGGDLKGIEQHLDYLQDLGVTALWLNPVIKNDMPERSEHGYAFTDHYEIEPRLGGNAAYHSLSDALHQRGMKLIQDAVYNHVGTKHFLYTDLPDSSWFHFWPAYTNTTYKDQVLMDPYGAEADRKRMSDGWFVPAMPDVNQRNPWFARFLIQHAIWSTEEYGLDGWRIDTYPYNDLEFMNDCNAALLREYPNLLLFGETWVHGVPNQAFFMRNKLDIPFKSNLPGTADFQLNMYGIIPALTQPQGWTEGVSRLHLTASNDFLYTDPMKNVIFLDNHDMSRIRSVVGEDDRLVKMGISWLLTFRGIPQLYYGTEIGMKNFSDPDGLVRLDFPGGFPGDRENKFTEAGRTAAENELFNHTRTLASFRKNAPALQHGRMMQFVPENGVYVYFRYTDSQTIMCIMNTTDETAELQTDRFKERTEGFGAGKDVQTGEEHALQNLKIAPKTMLVLELK